MLLAEVVYVKDEGRRFVILDAAMNDLIRPALYDGWHQVMPVCQARPEAPLSEADVVGPICESADTLARGRELPPLAPKDLIALGAAGAYASVMASTYNGRPLAPEVMVKGENFAVVRRRLELEQLLAQDSLPPWLDAAPREPARGLG